MNPSSSFRRRPESSVIYSSNRERHLGSGFRRSDEYIAKGLIDALNTGSKVDQFTRVFYNLPHPAALN